MKKRLILSIAMLLAVICVCANNKQPQKGARTIYYVVIASFENFEEACMFSGSAPGDDVWGNVYKAKANGRTVYRVCTGCYYSKANAQRAVSAVKNYSYRAGGPNLNPWIWANKGLATCANRALFNNGEPFPIKPE